MKTTQDTVQIRPESEALRKRLSETLASMPAGSRRKFKVMTSSVSTNQGAGKVRTYRLLDQTGVRHFIMDTHAQIPSGDQKWIVWSHSGDGQNLVDFATKAKIRKTDKRLLVLEDKGNEAERSKVLRRLLNTLSAPDYHSRIFQAGIVEVEGKLTLGVCSANLEWLRIPVSDILALHRLSLTELEAYEIDSDGSWLYWPEVDVHLGWEQLKQLCDKDAALKAKQRSANFNQRYGAAIRGLRKKHALRQSDIDGLGSRQVSRIESGHCRANSNALSHLAKAHAMAVNDYMGALAGELDES
jgi:hypothetical protein